tara:strand:+ start:807 stop:1205 length:399 start_codon:yes stop_codon:yes gene_type:complete
MPILNKGHFEYNKDSVKIAAEFYKGTRVSLITAVRYLAKQIGSAEIQWRAELVQMLLWTYKNQELSPSLRREHAALANRLRNDLLYELDCVLSTHYSIETAHSLYLETKAVLPLATEEQEPIEEPNEEDEES